MTKQANLNGSAVTIISVNGGWTQIQMADGSEKKVRNGALTPVVVVAPVAPAAQPQKEVKMTAAVATKPVPPVREPRPAHFVGDVAPGRLAKIGSTQFDLGRYFVSDIKTPTGRRTIDCADDIATALRGQDIDSVYAQAATALDTTVEALQEQYGHLNIGMQRMNLGNRIRGAGAAAEKAKAKAEAAEVREQAAEDRRAEKAKADAAKQEAIAARKVEQEAARAEKAKAKAAKQAA